MALEEGRFFRGAMTDKRHEADGMAAYFRRFLPSGVWEMGDNLKVTAAGGLAVNVGYGHALVDGYPYGVIDNGTGPLELALGDADALPRIDRVVVCKDAIMLRVSVRIKKGTPAASPEAPPLEADEISLARIAIAADATEINAANIMDERARVLIPADYLPLSGGTLTDHLFVDPGDASSKNIGIIRGSGSGIMTLAPADGNGGLVLGYSQNGTVRGHIKIKENSVPQFSPNGSTYYTMWHHGNMNYEEGSWTPTILGQTTNPTVTFTSRNARYIKIGRRVLASFFINIASISGGSGNLYIGGLPFAVDNSAVGAMSLGNLSYSNVTGVTVKEFGVFFNGTQSLFTYGNLGERLVTSNFGAGTILGGTLSYFTAA
jgi:hypothetical protein